MRVILDECLPRRLGRLLEGHVVTTVQGEGWSSVKNGELLKRIAGVHDVFVTVDANMPAQQNLGGLSFSVIVLRAASNRMEHLAPLAPQIIAALEQARPGELRIVGET